MGDLKGMYVIRKLALCKKWLVWAFGGDFGKVVEANRMNRQPELSKRIRYSPLPCVVQVYSDEPEPKCQMKAIQPPGPKVESMITLGGENNRIPSHLKRFTVHGGWPNPSSPALNLWRGGFKAKVVGPWRGSTFLPGAEMVSNIGCFVGGFVARENAPS